MIEGIRRGCIWSAPVAWLCWPVAHYVLFYLGWAWAQCSINPLILSARITKLLSYFMVTCKKSIHDRHGAQSGLSPINKRNAINKQLRRWLCGKFLGMFLLQRSCSELMSDGIWSLMLDPISGIDQHSSQLRGQLPGTRLFSQPFHYKETGRLFVNPLKFLLWLYRR